MGVSPLELLLAVLAGGILGLVYFGGLWLTVSAMQRVRSPALLFVGSFVLRMSLAVAGFWLVMAGQWERAAACLAGFVAVRIVLTRRLGSAIVVPGVEASP